MQHHHTGQSVADAIIREVGKTIVLGLPLGLGKAPHIANALYARAAADPSIRLTIFTALTLEKPRYRSTLERRFLEPVVERLFGGYPALAYAQALRDGSLPANIAVNEFFFLAGQWMGVPRAQQSYISANYTHAAGFLLDRGVNVIAQLVAKGANEQAPRYSLSCNTDLTLDLLAARRDGRADFLLVGQTNAEMPYMPGEGEIAEPAFAHMLDDPSTEFSLFAPPNEPVSLGEYAAGLHTARLVGDGGTLQLGIGRDGDAVSQALVLRHRHNDVFREALGRLSPALEGASGVETAPFSQGLHGVSEMFTAALLGLIDAGIVKREVDGAVLYAAFFLGPKAFYQALREMSPELRARIRMSAVSFTNQLYGDEPGKRRARSMARFINSTMMVTLLGAAVSDGLENGRVVSGVGGQYNFVAQAFELPGARSILMVKSTRGQGRHLTSNIRFRYGYETIPRHLRDILVSEYGVADLRGRTDAETIAALLAIADSRFQDELLRQAKEAGKIEKAYEIPAAFRNNTPQRIEQALLPLRLAGHLPPFPFGTDFDETEQKLLPVLDRLGHASRSWQALGRLALAGLNAPAGPGQSAALARLGLDHPKTFSDRFSCLLVRGAMRGL